MPAKLITRTFTLLTTAFPHGAYQSHDFNKPDLRSPSVKGQLRWWFDALYGNKQTEDRLFGGLKLAREQDRPGPQSSRVIVRVRTLGLTTPRKVEFMPHKGAAGGHKSGIPPGTKFEVSLLPRRGGWSDEEHRQIERVLDAWLLLGAIGQRANRGAGSIWPDDAPADAATFAGKVRALLAGTKLRAAVLNPSFSTETELRDKAGDFLSDEAFASSMTPFGSARPRKPSLLKLRAARLGGALHLVALWDGRFQAPDTLARGIAQLARSKDIGRMLEDAVPSLCG